MASPLVFLHRVLGFAAARRGRTLSGESPQHNGERFSNVAPRPVEGFGKTLGIAWNMLVNKPRNTVPTGALPIDSLTREQLDAAPDRSLYRLGHSTLLLKLRGEFWLTDPVFSERVSPVSFAGPRRQGPAGIAAVDLPRIDAVVISHNHYDHLDAASVKALSAQAGGSPLFIVPLGVKAWFTDAGIDRVVELDWWQSRRVGEVEVVLVPAQHWSGRSFSDRMETLWGGYAMFAPDFHLFFAGDTGYSKDFADIHARFAARHGGTGRGFDLALLPIGAYEPRWFMKEQHIDPAEAVQIHLDLAARRSIGIHWGTFALTDEALDEPPRALEAARRQRGLADDAFTVMAVGETRRFPRRGP